MEYGCIGKTLNHSYSAEVHNLLGNYEYTLKELRPDEVGIFLEKREFYGINVTIPYKETVIPYLNELDPVAQAIGAVNTVINRKGKLVGYNTDFYGMKFLLKRANINLSGKKVFILGTGGTSKTACAVAKGMGAERIYKVSRTPGKEDEIGYDTLLKKKDEVEILLNTTPVGMYPHEDEIPVFPEIFQNLEGVLDVVYHPLTTDFVRSAMKRHIPAVGGLYMLVAQATHAAELFFNDEGMTEKTETVYREMLKKKQNIVLIGMPGCGKTTQGTILARKTGMCLTDSDTEIEKLLGESVPNFLKREGEEAFRKVESCVIKELSRKTGVIISTGGGVVTRRDNVKALARNGILLFLDRSPGNITVTESRPLTSTRETLEKKYVERLPLYQAAADIMINADHSVEETANEIQKAIM